MKIYTGRGDEGLTDLRDMTRVSKSSLRIEAYGNADELNSLIGLIRPSGYDDVDDMLRSIQNHLHIVQADLANPNPDKDDPVITTDHVEQIETWIDDTTDELDPLESFILPGGSEPGSHLHHARSVCRRAERRAVAFVAKEDEANEHVATYLNRLSDLLFTLARLMNDREGIEEESPEY